MSLRLLRAFGDVAFAAEDPDHRQALVAMGKDVVAGCGEKLTDLELRDVQIRATALESLCCNVS